MPLKDFGTISTKRGIQNVIKRGHVHYNTIPCWHRMYKILRAATNPCCSRMHFTYSSEGLSICNSFRAKDTHSRRILLHLQKNPRMVSQHMQFVSVLGPVEPSNMAACYVHVRHDFEVALDSMFGIPLDAHQNSHCTLNQILSYNGSATLSPSYHSAAKQPALALP